MAVPTVGVTMINRGVGDGHGAGGDNAGDDGVADAAADDNDGATTVTALLHRGRAVVGGDAETLLATVTGVGVAMLIADGERAVTAAAAGMFDSLIKRRANGEPVAYLTGEKEFWSLPLTVTPAVMTPRPETELLVEVVLAARPSPATVLELGVGSGAVALALASELPDAVVTATDNSAAALAVAEGNAKKLALTNIQFCRGDWFAAAPAQRFDRVVANPPYIAAGDPHLAGDGVKFEPRAALVSADNGLADLKKIIAGAGDALNKNGMLLVEHGHDQAAAVREIFAQHRFTDITTHRDLAGNERVTTGEVAVVSAVARSLVTRPSPLTAKKYHRHIGRKQESRCKDSNSNRSTVADGRRSQRQQP